MIISNFLLLVSAHADPLVEEPGWQADSKQVQAWMKKKGKVFNYEEAKVPKYQLPEPLKTMDGKPIKTAEVWNMQRADLLKVFREQAYGIRPNTKYKVDYTEVGNVRIYLE